MAETLDLGHRHFARFVGWASDRDLNPRHDGLPDVERWGIEIEHPRQDGSGPCVGFATFDGDVQRQVHPQIPKWTVESIDPLTISPSVLCSCGDHGFIRQGLWVPA